MILMFSFLHFTLKFLNRTKEEQRMIEQNSHGSKQKNLNFENCDINGYAYYVLIPSDKRRLIQL